MALKQNLSDIIRSSDSIDWRRRLKLIVSLSIPAMMSQVSAVIMEYIDAAMVGHLGADASAAIGLVSTTTWLFFGVSSAIAIGFSVQVAHLLGAGKPDEARSVLRQALMASLIASLIITAIGFAIAKPLPHWLGGYDSINPLATLYFAIFILTLPVFQWNFLASGVLRSSGNMFVPGMVGVLMCALDVLFNFMLIFEPLHFTLFGVELTLPRAGLGLAGAAIGTGLASVVATVILLCHLWFRGGELKLKGTHGSYRPTAVCLRRAYKIGMPMGLERCVSTCAQIVMTIIVAPLGIYAIAANAFAVTAEGICYMPGYGIGDASTAVVGQSIGADKKLLARKFAKTTVILGMLIMTLMGIVMFIAAPLMMEIMTPVKEIVELGTTALRIEAFAEPMFAAAIVCYCSFVGAGDTLVPGIMNLGSIWLVRVTLAAVLAPVYGLPGVWFAMCVELCFRGAIFLYRFNSGKWMNRIDKLRH